MERTVLAVNCEYESKPFLPLTNRNWKRMQIYCHYGWNNKQISAGQVVPMFLALFAHLYPKSWIYHQILPLQEYHGQGEMLSHLPAESSRIPRKPPHKNTQHVLNPGTVNTQERLFFSTRYSSYFSKNFQICSLEKQTNQPQKPHQSNTESIIFFFAVPKNLMHNPII